MKVMEASKVTCSATINLAEFTYIDFFPVLNCKPEIEVLINPFRSAYQNDAMGQLAG
jgi:hypothetical protein